MPTMMVENASSSARPQASRPAKVKRCKYGDKCRTNNCKFRHPDPQVTVNQTVPVDSTTATPKSCKFGPKCRNKANCKFSHPPPPDEPKGEQGIPKKTAKACRFGLKCHSVNCKFQHPESGDSFTVASTVPSPTSIPLAADLENSTHYHQEPSSQPRDDLDLDRLFREQDRQRLEDTTQWEQGYMQPFSSPSLINSNACVPTIENMSASQRTAEQHSRSERIRPKARHANQAPNNANSSMQENQANVAQTQKPNTKNSEQKAKSKSQNAHQKQPSLHQNGMDNPQQQNNLTSRAPSHSQSSGSKPKSKQKKKQQQRDAGTKTDNSHEVQSSNHPKPPPAPCVSRKAKSKAVGAVSPAASKQKMKDPPLPTPPLESSPAPANMCATRTQQPPEIITVPDNTPAEAAPYATELQQLISMGFTDTIAAQAALGRAEGSVKDAIEILLMTPLDQLREMGYTNTEEAQAALDQSNGSIQHAVEVLVAAAVAREQYKAERRAAKKERIAKERQLKLEEQQQAEAERIATEERLQREEFARQLEEADGIDKVARKAAKKERQRLARHSKQAELSSLSSSAIKEIKEAGSCETETTAGEEDEEQKKQRWREEIRLQKERAAAKREQAKKKRHEQFLKEEERQLAKRDMFWQAYIDEEAATVGLLLRLCAAEFCRVNPEVDEGTIMKDEKASQILHEECRRAFRVLYKESVSRIVVKGVKQQDLKDRTGVINHWEEQKKKFSVWLDTKKGKETQLAYFEPCNLEAVPDVKATTKKKHVDPVVTILVGPIYLGKCLLTDIFKSEVDRIKRYDSDAAVGSFLADLMQERNEEELEAKQREAEERLNEEAERERRARRREREQREWEERQAEFRRRKEEYKEYKRQARRENQRWNRGGGYGHGPSCRCPDCFLEKMFFGGHGGPGFSFFFGPRGPFVDDDEDYYNDEDQWDSHFNHLHEEEERQKIQDAADVLGVNVDAPQDEIKRVFRKKALKFHPDKFREDNHEGMTRDECEEHFKELSNAYDCLYGQFE